MIVDERPNELCEGEQRVVIDGKLYSRIISDDYPNVYCVQTQGRKVAGEWQTLSNKCRAIIQKIDEACDSAHKLREE